MLRGSVTCPRLRRPAAMMAAGLIALQALLAGLATAQAAVVLAASPADVAIICHGQGGGDPDHNGAPGSVPDPLKAAHLCCVACAGGGPPAMLAQVPAMPRALAFQNLPSSASGATAGPIARRAVRDGPSQAPPTLA
jgi:hypothetical protein